jgi:hypothetical protein
MIQKIELYFFILSIIFSIRFVIEFVSKLREENPTPMQMEKHNQAFLYLATTYIVTYLIINLF